MEAEKMEAVSGWRLAVSSESEYALRLSLRHVALGGRHPNLGVPSSSLPANR